MPPSFLDVHKLLMRKGPTEIISSKNTNYSVGASIISKGPRRGEKVIIAKPGSGTIYIHEDCFGNETTCQGAFAGGIYNGSPSIYDWYERKSSINTQIDRSPSATKCVAESYDAKNSISWNIDKYFTEKIRAMCDEAAGKPFVKKRRERCIESPPANINRQDVWTAIVACLVSTQQRSGPNSPASIFLRMKPFPLAYDSCLSRMARFKWFKEQLASHRLRRNETIAHELEHNFNILERGEWEVVLAQLNSLAGKDDPAGERRVANYIRSRFKGFGPKQSRNLVQSLGLSKYEIPIDSRIVTWLKEIDFPVPLSRELLSDAEYFEFVSDGIQAICKEAGICPCILDAVVFSSYDGDGWTNENVIW